MSKYPSFLMSRFLSTLEGLNIMTIDDPQNMVSFLAKQSYSLPTRSATRKRKVFLASTTGCSRWIQQLQVAAMWLLVTSSVSLSTQLVRKTSASQPFFTRQSPSSQSPETKSFCMISAQMATPQRMDLFSLVTSQKEVKWVPSLAHSLSLQQRLLLRQLQTNLPLRSKTAAELYSAVSPPSCAFQMYPKATQAFVRMANSLANQNQTPCSCTTAKGNASQKF